MNGNEEERDRLIDRIEQDYNAELFKAAKAQMLGLKRVNDEFNLAVEQAKEECERRLSEL